MQFSVKQIAAILEATIEGDDEVMVNRPSRIEEGGEGSITFLANPKYEEYVYTTTASVIVVDKNFVAKASVRPTLLRVDKVYEAFAGLLTFYDQAIQHRPQGISDQAFIHPEASLGEGVAIGRFVTVEKGAVVESGAVLFDHVFIGADTKVGKGSIFFPGARLMHQCELGNYCIIHANVVIGSDGFGFAPDKEGIYQKIPQVGHVIIEDHVEIGANSTIDRATMGATIIRKGVKLDNLVQIAHNVEIGEHTVIAALTGVAGSTKVGKNCRIGGQVGITGHITVADGTQVQAQSGISRTIKTPGQAFFGSPAIAYNDYIRSYGVFKKLPDLYKQLYRLEKEVEALKRRSE